VELITTVFYGLIVTPITNNFTVEFVVSTILAITYPVWFLYFLVTTFKPRIINSLLAPIEVHFTSSTPNHSRRRRTYHQVKNLLHHRHCSSCCSRTGCRFQRSSSHNLPGGGCGKSRHKSHWKATNSTRRKSGQFYHHHKPSTVFRTSCSSRITQNGSSLFIQACSIPTELFFFDSLDTLDDILFDDAVSSFPIDIFHPCYNYCNDDLFLNQYKETGTETYFKTSTCAIDKVLLNIVPNKPVSPSDTASLNDQVKLELPFIDYLAPFDPFLLNDRSRLSSPSEAAFCLPCDESIPSSDNITY
jgi:hypothetical protein